MDKKISLDLERELYLNTTIVKSFTFFLTNLMNGSKLNHCIIIRDPKIPENDIRKENSLFFINSLETAFTGYWWNRGNFELNAQKLLEVQLDVRSALKCSSSNNVNEVAFDALRKVLNWGAGGTGQKLYQANEAWAKSYKSNLYQSLKIGCLAMTSCKPNLSVFNPNTETVYARMNAGLTKFYALACDNVVIYDGRVGAALGYLVKLFCKENLISEVPNELSFRWGAQSGKNPLNRNPSDAKLVFHKLPAGGPVWAENNIKANWILRSAIENSNAKWCSGPDGLRRVEAALFVIGYSMPVSL